MHVCYDSKQNYAICSCTDNKLVPKFNSFIYDKNEKQVGKIEEVFGPISKFFISFKSLDGYKLDSIQKDSMFGIRSGQLIPVERFRPQPTIKRAAKEKKTADKKPFQTQNKFGGNRPQGRFQGNGGRDGGRDNNRFQDRGRDFNNRDSRDGGRDNREGGRFQGNSRFSGQGRFSK
uniref:H/ACA ribonucleoprotein complex subunit n=1 Tax=Trepomonas sp. PC1 TaxID=1076344 RepID=A0A146KHZ3_9EUKA|eukprot:JAP94869.1 Nucleolar GAR1-like protein [Trepomonas sp. PC1]